MARLGPDELISRVVHRLEPGALVARYLLVAEVIVPEDGSTAVWITGSKGLERWDTYGLLTEALTNEKIKHQQAEED